MYETSKAVVRRMSNPSFINHYFVGHGIDIGSGPDSLAQYGELFTRMISVRTWDLPDGDAQLMAGIPDETFDFVHSSHCLEHLNDPLEGLRSWMRILRPGRHLVVLVPDEDMYEQGVFPSTWNADHKYTFTVFKERSWSARSINLLDLVRSLGPAAELVSLQVLSATYRFGLPRYDQTMTPVGEAAIELVIRKRPARELEAGGRLPPLG